MPTDTPTLDALLIPDTEAARLCSVSRASWHRWRAAGTDRPNADPAGPLGPLPPGRSRAVGRGRVSGKLREHGLQWKQLRDRPSMRIVS